MQLRWLVAVSLAAIVGSALSVDQKDSTQCKTEIDSHYPRQYVAYKARTAPVIDGRLDEPFWEEVGFSESFVDISTSTKPWLDTKVKIRWDDEWLYVGAKVSDPNVWANITYTCHCLNSTEDQIIFHGNDFEVFVDADGTTRWYKEFEINAANADWDLLLDRPYENNGYENSTRVFGSKGFDMVPPLVSATYTDGVLNDPSSKPTFWSVEIAFPMYKLAYHTTASLPVKPGEYWRINFSRVEWAVKIVDNKYWLEPSCQSCPTPGQNTCDNWVWSPMYAIDMHHPEMWGFLQFADDKVNQTSPKKNEQWPGRYVAHELYYAQVAYAQANNGSYTDNIDALGPFANHPSVLNGECTQLPTIQLSANGTSYVASIASLEQGVDTITIDENRLILAVPPSTTTPAPQPPASYTFVQEHCTDAACSVGCANHTFATGRCLPLNGGGSAIVKCSTSTLHIRVFQSNDCSGSYTEQQDSLNQCLLSGAGGFYFENFCLMNPETYSASTATKVFLAKL
jgi:hypothetical protein